jgi:hypothetical protein
VKTNAQTAMIQTERKALGVAVRAAVPAFVRIAVVVACVAAIIKRHASLPINPSRAASGLMGFNWKQGYSIRGASPLVANG